MIKRILTRRASQDIKKLMMQPYIRIKDLNKGNHQIVFINEISENGEVAITYDVPRPWGDGDLAWVDAIELLQVSTDKKYKMQKRRNNDEEDE